jgi:hypothetical protein
VVGAWVTAVLGAWLLRAVAHPVHTSVTEIMQAEDGRSLRIEMRLFASDLEEAIGTAAGHPGADSVMSAYLQRRFVLLSAAGASIRLRWDESGLKGDVVSVRMSAAAPEELAGIQVTDSVLCERFADQVNVVRARYGARAATLIFTRGDRAKRLT